MVSLQFLHLTSASAMNVERIFRSAQIIKRTDHRVESMWLEKYQEFFVATNPEGINNGALQNAIDIDWKLPRYQRINLMIYLPMVDHFAIAKICDHNI